MSEQTAGGSATIGEHAHGSCLCGAVRFEIDLPAKWTANCHCRLCRRSHAAPFVTWTGVERDAFRLAAGEDLLRSYRSSGEAERRFCSQCGSAVTFESTRWPGEVHVPTALLAEPHPLRPLAHAFWDDRAEWISHDPSLPVMGGPDGTQAQDGS